MLEFCWPLDFGNVTRGLASSPHVLLPSDLASINAATLWCLGGGFLLFIDTLARTLAPVEIPLGILTALVGSPFFIVLLRRSQAGWG